MQTRDILGQVPKVEEINHEDLIDALRLYRSTNIGMIAYEYLKKKYGSVKEAIQALSQCDFIWRGKKCVLVDRDEVLREIDQVKEYGGDFYINEDYMYLPPIMTYKGNIDLIHKQKIGFVGSRNATLAGMKFCKDLVCAAKSVGVIVSGLALGIDATAHQNALENTIAVIPGGINIKYPSINTCLQSTIEETGLVITDEKFNVPAQAQLFLKRNRIIAALSNPLCVIEAASTSGSLHTARAAHLYKHTVFAVPGHPFDSNYCGCNQLIQENIAKPLLSPEDLIYYMAGPLKTFKDVYYLDMNVSQEEKDQIYNLLSCTPANINDLAAYVPLPKLLSILGELEYENKIDINNFHQIIRKY